MKFKSLFTLIAAGSICMASGAMAQPTGDKQPTKEVKKEMKKEQKELRKEATGAMDGAKVGEKAPAFELTDSDGKKVSLADLTKQKKIVVLEWYNPECPYVKKHHQANKTMSETAKAFKDKNVVWLAVNSGKTTAEDNNASKKTYGIEYPVLMDTDTKVAAAYGAKNTPTMYIINADGVLAYRGAIDDNPDAGTLGKKNYVKQALEQIIKGETVTEPQTKAYGCHVAYGESKDSGKTGPTNATPAKKDDKK
jgi:peroxiredoxin